MGAALAREDLVSSVLEKLIEERLAEKQLADGCYFARIPGTNVGKLKCDRRQLAREDRLSNLLEKLIEKRVAEKQLADGCHFVRIPGTNVGKLVTASLIYFHFQPIYVI